MLVGILCYMLGLELQSALRPPDFMALTSLGIVAVWVGGFVTFFGLPATGIALFPLSFLLFIIPLPEALLFRIITALQYASAEVVSLLFQLCPFPFTREGLYFTLPGLQIEVAKECSGIRSSLVLVITSLLAANMFLHTTWRRALLVCAVIPLGLLRNGLRILVISLLCVHIGPQMINSVIHRRGGPVFFVASLVPLFVMLWWLRRGDVAVQQRRAPENSKSIPADVPIV